MNAKVEQITEMIPTGNSITGDDALHALLVYAVEVQEERGREAALAALGVLTGDVLHAIAYELA